MADIISKTESKIKALEQHLNVMKAFLAGSKIEYYSNGAWIEIDSPVWDKSLGYRIKHNAVSEADRGDIEVPTKAEIDKVDNWRQYEARAKAIKEAQGHLKPNQEIRWYGEIVDETWPKSALIGMLHNYRKTNKCSI